MESILLVGCGNMGGAMLAGWLAVGMAPARFTVVDPVLAEAPQGVTLLRALQAVRPLVLRPAQEVRRKVVRRRAWKVAQRSLAVPAPSFPERRPEREGGRTTLSS